RTVRRQATGQGGVPGSPRAKPGAPDRGREQQARGDDPDREGPDRADQRTGGPGHVAREVGDRPVRERQSGDEEQDWADVELEHPESLVDDGADLQASRRRRDVHGAPLPGTVPPSADRWQSQAALPSGRCIRRDRKSTRLNSSHVKISYAVFCLKKKTYI